MKDSQQMMIEAQAAHITRLNDQVRVLLDQIKTLERQVMIYQKSRDLYMEIQKTCISDPVIMEAWQEFIAIAKLSSDDDLEKKWTKENYRY